MITETPSHMHLNSTALFSVDDKTNGERVNQDPKIKILAHSTRLSLSPEGICFVGISIVSDHAYRRSRYAGEDQVFNVRINPASHIERRGLWLMACYSILLILPLTFF